jgi:protein disulfide-isomerase A1
MVVFNGDAEDEDALVAFVAENSLPLIDEVSPENYATYAESGLPLLYVFIKPDFKQREELVESLKPLAKELKNKVNVVWIDAEKFAEHGKSLSVDIDNTPAVVIQDMATRSQKFVMPSKVDAASVKSFVSDFTAGKLTPTIKSAPVPASQDEPVYTLVSSEFDKVVYDDEKDVFVEFYAPWCGHCRMWRRCSLTSER